MSLDRVDRVGAVGGGGGGALLLRSSSSFFCAARNTLMKSAFSSNWSSPIPIDLSSARSFGSILAMRASLLALFAGGCTGACRDCGGRS